MLPLGSVMIAGRTPAARSRKRRGHQQHLNLAVQDAVGDHTGLVKYRVRGYHRYRKLSFYGNRIGRRWRSSITRPRSATARLQKFVRKAILGAYGLCL